MCVTLMHATNSFWILYHYDKRHYSLAIAVKNRGTSQSDADQNQLKIIQLSNKVRHFQDKIPGLNDLITNVQRQRSVQISGRQVVES